MRRILSLFLVAAFCLPLFGGQRPADAQFPKQHRAMHWIVTENDQAAGGCTATAIGPHALLTAGHCQLDPEALDASKVLFFVDQPGKPDYLTAQTPYEIQAKLFDGNDHMILLLSGPAFQDIAPYEVAIPYQGEHIAWFGNPAGIRDQFREGMITGQIQDGQDGIAPGVYYWMAEAPCIGGDSGSYVFDEKTGKLLGLVTYGIDHGIFMGMFPLKFEQAQIALAKIYDGRNLLQ